MFRRLKKAAKAAKRVWTVGIAEPARVAMGKPFTTRVALMWQHVVTKYGPTSKK
ncbi:MAG: hypothetical protein QGI60_00080 [archaeon]|jgi:hypothetical protein|nr:hypothetical protein [archaeon]